MDRYDLPNLIEKRVILCGLKNSYYNEKNGTVLAWNDERRRFLVDVESVEIPKLFKATNLTYCPLPQNAMEKRCIFYLLNRKFVAELSFEEGLKIFGTFYNEGEHRHVFWKIKWLRSYLDTHVLSGDRRYLENLKSELESIIENSNFRDLIIHAKLIQQDMLPHFLYVTDINITRHFIDLTMDKWLDFAAHGGYFDEHFGYLPKIFLMVSKRSDRVNLKTLKKFYNLSKNIIDSGTGLAGCEGDFICAAILFFKLWMTRKPCKKLFDEIQYLRTLIEHAMCKNIFQADKPDLKLRLAYLDFWEKKYHDCLKNLNVFQAKITSTNGHSNMILAWVYELKTKCYIALDNKSMAKKAFQKFKRYPPEVGQEKAIVKKLENQIKKIRKNLINVDDEPKNSVRTLVQCSAHDCPLA